jgi:CRISPR-associated protein Csm4
LKLYEITLKPLSGFGTPLKGDTLFGHFCWQIANDDKLCGRSLEELLENYHASPFIVISSAYPTFCIENKYHYAFKTPDMPLDRVFNLPDDKKECIKKRKEFKAKKWMLIKEKNKFISFKELEFLSDEELIAKANLTVSKELLKRLRYAGSKQFISLFDQPHNTINRITGTTGEGRFAPFIEEQQVYYPETELALFVGVDESFINIDQMLSGLKRIGECGFGKDASSGLGKFMLGKENEIDIKDIGSDLPNACYTLSPCVPEKDTYSDVFFMPFTRYGKHGDVLAKSGNPFKNPVIMADEGAVFLPKSKGVFNKPYIGQAVPKVSKAEPKTVVQGYSLYIPVNVEV